MAFCKGIVLAGGNGTRLFPVTKATSKQLLPIYDKPMIFYPLTTLMENDIREILIICMPKHLEAYNRVLEDGKQWGIDISYALQEQPRGIADAFIVGENFIDKNPVALILGDNIFHGNVRFNVNTLNPYTASVFAYYVHDPHRYGVVKFYRNDPEDKPVEIIEKPCNPPSNYAVTGLYLYANNASEYAKGLKPSSRGELEITDLNQLYLTKNELRVVKLDKGVAWLDSGTYGSLLEAAHYVEVIQKRTGLRVGCPETTAKNKGWI